MGNPGKLQVFLTAPRHRAARLKREVQWLQNGLLP